MFERYSHPGRRVVYYAHEAAIDAGAAEIDSMHLLCALTMEQSSRANSVFRLKERLPQEAARMRAVRLSSEKRTLPLSNDCKRILAYAAQEADGRGDYWVNTDHLVLGILSDRECPAAVRLQASGIELEKAVARVSSSTRERGSLGFVSEFWRPLTPSNIVGQIAAAAYLLLVVILLGVVAELLRVMLRHD